MLARENFKKERETVTGHYTDVLIKEGGRWLFLAWAETETIPRNERLIHSARSIARSTRPRAGFFVG